jgi:uncharacterized membrane protein YkvA (DUF1232 family)
MNSVVRALVIGFAVVGASWVVLIALAATLPAGALKELAAFLPNAVTLVRRLRQSDAVPRRAKLALGFAALWVLSPIDLVPEFLPIVGPLDDAVVIALCLRYAARAVPRDVLLSAWPGKPATIERLLGPRPSTASGKVR